MGSEDLTTGHVEARVERFAAMGTRVELHVFGTAADDVLRRARRAIEAVDDALTIHRPSAATAMNERLAAGREATVDDPILLAALAETRTLSALTGGLFDPTAGSPTAIGARWHSIDLDIEGARIKGERPLAFDFGGFGKGYALDCAGRTLRAAGATSAFLSAGESSILVIGRHPLGARWPVGIPHPLGHRNFLVELELENEALSISSTFGVSAEVPDRSATVRPSTGEAVTKRRMAVAVEPSGAAAEAISTALLIADAGERRRLVDPRLDRRLVFRFDQERAIPLISKQELASHDGN